MQRAKLFYIFCQYSKNVQVSPDCFSFITDISSYNSQLTLVYMLHNEKQGKTVIPFVFIMAFPFHSFCKTVSHLSLRECCKPQTMRPTDGSYSPADCITCLYTLVLEGHTLVLYQFLVILLIWIKCTDLFCSGNLIIKMLFDSVSM